LFRPLITLEAARFQRGRGELSTYLIPPIPQRLYTPQWVPKLVGGMTSPFDGIACFWLSLVWIQLGIINAGLEFLKDFVPLQLVRLREIEDEEREIEGECTLGAISIRMFAF